jgi:hypothetical protein
MSKNKIGTRKSSRVNGFRIYGETKRRDPAKSGNFIVAVRLGWGLSNQAPRAIRVWTAC